MGQASEVLRRSADGYAFFCPGCETTHHVRTDGNERPRWDFNGNVDAPAFTPSILVHWFKTSVEWEAALDRGEPSSVEQGKRGRDMVCHSFVTDGRIQFLSDCTHELAGKTVPLPELPDWLQD